MSENGNYPAAITVARALAAEKRGITWARDAITMAHDNLLLAAKEIPATEEFAALRMAYYRALDALRQARGATGKAYDLTVVAQSEAEGTAATHLTDYRLIERYHKRGANGAKAVENARKERENRERTFRERQRQREEQERQEFLKKRKQD